MQESGFIHPGIVSVPESLAGQPVVRSVSGPQAVEEINQLHRKDFQFSSGAVGWYGLQHQVTLWVSGARLQFIAGRTLSEMQERISEGRSPFQPTGQRNDGNRRIYEMDGMGQKHFTFQSKNLVIWLAVEPSLANQALTEVLEYYP
jgi:hypothetical protein